MTWLAYYGFTCVYVPNYANLVDAFVHNDVSLNHRVYKTWRPRRNTDVSGKVTDIYGAASGIINFCIIIMLRFLYALFTRLQ